jgi:hypothetical protein
MPDKVSLRKLRSVRSRQLQKPTVAKHCLNRMLTNSRYFGTNPPSERRMRPLSVRHVTPGGSTDALCELRLIC